MRRAARVNVNCRAKVGEAPRGAGVIEMDVAKKNVANVARFRAELSQRGPDVLES